MNKTRLLILILILVLGTLSVQLFMKTPSNTNAKNEYEFYFIAFVIIISVISIFFICNRIREKYLEEDPILIEIKELLCPVFPEINNTILMKGEKSYTINKSRIHICLKDENNNYYDKNMLIYVILHELSHVKCDEVGHTEKFHSIFKKVIEKAVKEGVYDDSIPPIKNYCEIPNIV